MNNIGLSIKFDWDNYVLVQDTLGCMGHQYRAFIRDPIGFGSANTQINAVRSLIKSLRSKADEIESKLNQIEQNDHSS